MGLHSSTPPLSKHNIALNQLPCRNTKQKKKKQNTVSQNTKPLSKHNIALNQLPCQNTKQKNKRNKIQLDKIQNPCQNTTLLSINFLVKTKKKQTKETKYKTQNTRPFVKTQH